MTCGGLLDLVPPEVDPHDPPTRKLYISTKHVDSALLAILKLFQLKAAILFSVSRPYRIDTLPYEI